MAENELKTLRMEISKTVKIAQEYMDGENTSLSDVLNAFQGFIDANKPLTKKSWCLYEMSLFNVLDVAMDLGIIISDEEAGNFLDRFYIPDGNFGDVEELFMKSIENKFKEAPQGSMFDRWIEENEVEKVSLFIDWNSSYYSEDLVFSFLNEPRLNRPIELASKHNFRDIVKVLLQHEVIVNSEIVEKATDLEIKRMLSDAWQEQSAEVFALIEANDLESIKRIIDDWENAEFSAEIIDEAKPYGDGNKTLYEVAIEKGNREIAEFLQEKSVDFANGSKET